MTTEEYKLEEEKFAIGGQKLVDLLYLKKNKKKRYPTSWGDKTLLGLFLTVRRVVEENL